MPRLAAPQVGRQAFALDATRPFRCFLITGALPESDTSPCCLLPNSEGGLKGLNIVRSWSDSVMEAEEKVQEADRDDRVEQLGR